MILYVILIILNIIIDLNIYIKNGYFIICKIINNNN